MTSLSRSTVTCSFNSRRESTCLENRLMAKYSWELRFQLKQTRWCFTSKEWRRGHSQWWCIETRVRILREGGTPRQFLTKKCLALCLRLPLSCLGIMPSPFHSAYRKIFLQVFSFTTQSLLQSQRWKSSILSRLFWRTRRIRICLNLSK